MGERLSSDARAAGIRTGLLQHRYFVSGHSEYDPEEYPDEFWDWRDDRPPPSEDFPLGFVIRRLRLYFANQLDRFCAQVLRDEPAGKVGGVLCIVSETTERVVAQERQRQRWLRLWTAVPGPHTGIGSFGS
jgi:hypothetical protein